MTRQRVEDKVGAWYTAFNAVKEELTTPTQRGMFAREDVGRRIVAANDRTAAMVAALLVGSGGRPISRWPGLADQPFVDEGEATDGNQG